MKRLLVQLLLAFNLLVAALFSSGPAAADQKTTTTRSNVVGEYYRGDGLGQNDSLNLNSDTTFVYSEASDDGQSAKWSGTYTFTKNHLTLTPSANSLSLRATSTRACLRCSNDTMILPTGLEPQPVFPLKALLAITWGKRLYLIPEEDIRHFCNDINLGEEPRGEIHGDYFVRQSNPERGEVDMATGRPALPAPGTRFCYPLR